MNDGVHDYSSSGGTTIARLADAVDGAGDHVRQDPQLHLEGDAIVRAALRERDARVNDPGQEAHLDRNKDPQEDPVLFLGGGWPGRYGGGCCVVVRC